VLKPKIFLNGYETPAWGWGPAGPPDSLGASPDEGQAAQPELPGTDELVSFAAHIKPLFRPMDKKSMIFAFDLWSYDDVSRHADAILDGDPALVRPEHASLRRALERRLAASATVFGPETG